VQASKLASVPPAYQSGQLSRKARVDSPKSVRIHSKNLTSVSIHLKKCVPIYWLILLGQEILCVQASRLASLPPAHQSGQPNGNAKCYHHSLTKHGNVRNLTNGHISRLGHPRAILTRPTSGETESKASFSSCRLLSPQWHEIT
jgi:hypothetical protein